MIAVPVKVLACVGRFSYTVVISELSGADETRVSKNGMDPSVLGCLE